MDNSGKTVFRGKYFGTDGFRGEAGAELRADQAFSVGRFLGYFYSKNGTKARIVIGKDTRRSSYMLEYALSAGVTASGGEAYMLHVTTTPGVSYATAAGKFDCGVMISASHNPYYDNGIKLVNGNGEKMEDGVLALIEEYLDTKNELPWARRDGIGAIIDYSAGRNRYMGYLISLVSNSFRGLRIGLDCANGAAWMIAPAVFEALGAHVYTVNASPDGENINKNAGSTHIDVLRDFVKSNSLDIGFAFDGDADRCIAVDENGNEVNGDHIIYILASRMRRKDMLVGNTVVTTVMSNAGLFRALHDAGIECRTTKVGDRYVYEEMVRGDYRIGGEQSGHIIIRKYATTGDGILTALMLTEEMLDRKTTLARLAAPITILPQIMKSVRVGDKQAAYSDPDVTAEIKKISDELGEDGRILLRISGTESVLRVMVEAPDNALCQKLADRAASVIKLKYSITEDSYNV